MQEFILSQVKSKQKIYINQVNPMNCFGFIANTYYNQKSSKKYRLIVVHMSRRVLPMLIPHGEVQIGRISEKSTVPKSISFESNLPKINFYSLVDF